MEGVVRARLRKIAGGGKGVPVAGEEVKLPEIGEVFAFSLCETAEAAEEEEGVGGVDESVSPSLFGRGEFWVAYGNFLPGQVWMHSNRNV